MASEEDVGNEKELSESETFKILQDGLNDVQKTVDGGGYALVSLDAANKGISNLPPELKRFIHLRHINLSRNLLKNIDVVIHLPHVLTLDVSHNLITGIAVLASPCLLFCQRLDLSDNKIEELGRLALDRLQYVSISENLITTTTEMQLSSSVLSLDISRNKIETFEKTRFPKGLRYLDASYNPLQNLGGIQDIRNIEVLKATNVPISNILELHKLKHANKLTQLDMSGSPIGNTTNFVYEMLGLMPQLKIINDATVDSSFRQLLAESSNDATLSQSEGF